ncbi:hypothetical protein TNCV_1911661 [Trichonephila clavipes]|nr:hypothetical protein TNCV_1911661 [Trichonephila clavipes]
MIRMESCSNFDSDEDISLRESDYEKSDESADRFDNIPINQCLSGAGDDTECILHNCRVPGRFATRNVLRQSSG